MENKKSIPTITLHHGERTTNAADRPSKLMRLFEARLKAVQLTGKASNRASARQIKNEVPLALIDALIYRFA